jgi:EmrB/QacA subfamily drug resistance transporter
MATASTRAEALSSSQRLFTLIGILLGVLLAALDQTIVATAGPAIQADLRIAPAVYPWLTTAYFVASTVMLPIYGKLSDLHGRKPVLVAGICIFVAGSVLCGLAWGTVPLILFRTVQGLGSAALFTSAFTLVADLYPPAERGKYQGLIGAVFALAGVVGPLAGGFLTDALGWHWVFFINLPVGAVALAFILLRMPALHPRAGHPRPRLDLAGALTLVLAVVPLLLALSLGRADPREGLSWGSWPILALLALGAVGLVLFLAAERRAPEPLLDLRLFTDRTFAMGNLAVFILGAGFLSVVVFLPLFMVNVVGLSATSAGLTLTPLTFGVLAGNVLAGQLVSRLGHYRRLLLGALVLLTAGYALMGFTLSPDSTQASVTVKMVIVGLGIGPGLPLYLLAIQNAVSPWQVGMATSSVTFFRQMGSTLGVAVMGAVFAATLASEVSARTAEATAGLPPAVRERLRPEQVSAGGEGALAGRLYSSEEVTEALRALVARQRREVEERLEGPAQAEALVRLHTLEAQAMAAVPRVERALAEAFTHAMAFIYRLAILIAVLGFVATLFLPELPLRQSHAPGPRGSG